MRSHARCNQRKAFTAAKTYQRMVNMVKFIYVYFKSMKTKQNSTLKKKKKIKDRVYAPLENDLQNDFLVGWLVWGCFFFCQAEWLLGS